MSEIQEMTIEDVINTTKKNNRKSDSKLIRKVYNYAKAHHEGQLRKSGEPYIIHPVQVAYILSTLGLDDSTICAALLHDVVEDTEITKQDLENEFGEEIAELVDGVTKLSKLQYASMEEQQVENYRKMFLAMGKDIRVILIKLADRLHNMRTLKYLTRDRQIANANETMELYAPLANRLGMYSLKWELEDLAFKYLYPEEYRELVEGIDRKREERLQFIDMIMEQIKLSVKKQHIEAEITGRAKHLYSIYRKMKRDNITLDQVYDLFALRVIVNSIKDCYAVLGIVHELYSPMPGRFKDYISVPKPNMYQSLHTTLIGPKGTPFEVRLILVYPMNVGRCIPEILRALNALQVADSNKASTPANWIPCQPVILPPPQTFMALQERQKEIEKNQNGMNWYLSFKNPKDCKITGDTECNRIEEDSKKIK